MLPSFSTTKMRATMPPPRATVSTFMMMEALFSDGLLGRQPSTKSLYSVPASVLRSEDRVLQVRNPQDIVRLGQLG